MGSSRWLTRKSRLCVPWREDDWVARWERETGNKPNVELVRTRVRARGPELYNKLWKFKK